MGLKALSLSLCPIGSTWKRAIGADKARGSTAAHGYACFAQWLPCRALFCKNQRRVRLHTVHHSIVLEGKALLQLEGGIAIYPGKPWMAVQTLVCSIREGTAPFSTLSKGTTGTA